MEALREIRDQGLVSHIGVTGANLELLTRLVSTGEFASVITYLKYDLLVQSANETLIPTAASHNTAVVLGSPLHMGLLGSQRNAMLEEGKFSDVHDKLRRLEAMLRAEGVLGDDPEELPRLGLRYLLSNPNVTTLLSGVATVAEIEVSAAVSEKPHLDPELIRKIEALE
jgi:aryl-alcohol dehydrogenase-like predicted oxidoreductase